MPRASSSRGLRLVMSAPSNTMRPERAGSMPNTVLNMVDLPAPFGPITVVIAPRATVQSVPCRMVILPYPATTSSSVRIASVAKIRLDDFRVAAQVGRIALCNDAAFGQHHDARAQRHDEFHVVLDHHEGRALLAVDRFQAVAQVRQHREIDAAGRLIEQHEARPR